MRMYLDPPRSKGITVQDRRGRVLAEEELHDLANRRIKWVRRAGSRLMVMVEGPVKGKKGTLLYFPRPADYDTAIRKVFAPCDCRH